MQFLLTFSPRLNFKTETLKQTHILHVEKLALTQRVYIGDILLPKPMSDGG